jgi:hypothetical protein
MKIHGCILLKHNAQVQGDGYSYKMKGIFDRWLGPTPNSRFEYLVPSMLGLCDSDLVAGNRAISDDGVKLTQKKSTTRALSLLDAFFGCNKHCASVVTISSTEHVTTCVLIDFGSFFRSILALCAALLASRLAIQKWLSSRLAR